MKVALIGYGEVGRILGEDLRRAGHPVWAFDVKLASGAGASMRDHAAAHGITLGDSHAGATREAELVVSAVTASQTVAAARDCAPALSPGSFFLDFNSASPGTKIDAATHVARGGGRYVEGAVMTAVPPHRIKVPLLIGGPYAEEVKPVLESLGFAPRAVSPRLGVASATKMCRSVIIKGLEALVVESLTAARSYHVEDAVIASLGETFPAIDWERQATYFFQRVIEHGGRRSEEMREAALAVSEAGLQPWSATATAERQAWMGELGHRGVFGSRDAATFARQADWRVEADRILEHVGRER